MFDYAGPKHWAGFSWVLVLMLWEPMLAHGYSPRLLAIYSESILATASLDDSKQFIGTLRLSTQQAQIGARERSLLLTEAHQALEELQTIELRFEDQATILEGLRQLRGGIIAYEHVLADESISNAKLLRVLRVLEHAGSRRAAYLEHKLLDIDGRISALEQELRANAVEDWRQAEKLRRIQGLLPKRHGLYASASPFFAHAPALGGGVGLGWAFSLQANVSDRAAGFLALNGAFLNDAKATGIPEGADVFWLHNSLLIGAAYYLTPPVSFVSFQAGGGVGFFISSMDANSPVNSGQQLGTDTFKTSGASFLMRTEIGAAPPNFSYEPFMTLGCMFLLGGSGYRKDFRSDFGRVLIQVGLGLRWRYEPRKNS